MTVRDDRWHRPALHTLTPAACGCQIRILADNDGAAFAYLPCPHGFVGPGWELRFPSSATTEEILLAVAALHERIGMAMSTLSALSAPPESDGETTAA